MKSILYLVSQMVTMLLAQQQQPTTYLDVGGIFPLLTTTGTVDTAGVMRQAGHLNSIHHQLSKPLTSH